MTKDFVEFRRGLSDEEIDERLALYEAREYKVKQIGQRRYELIKHKKKRSKANV